MNIKTITAKSILTPSKLPGADYVINPYTGCAFGCSYCYAAFMGRFSGHGSDEWGSYLDVKVNAAEVLEKELRRFRVGASNQQEKSGRFKSPDLNRPVILIGSVTDPYQGVESKYKITRQCLEVLARSEFRAEVSILTKSPLVRRDIDIIKKLKKSTVGMTVTSTDDKVSKLLENAAPIASARIRALKKLNDAGIKTYVCINPLLPHFAANEKDLRKLFKAISDAGTKEIWLEHINLGGKKLERLKNLVSKKAPNSLKYFKDSQQQKYKDELNRLIFGVLEDFDLEIQGGGIIDHRRHEIITSGNIEKVNVRGRWKVRRM